MAASAGNARFRVILVEPEYEINLGSVARAMRNFGFSELFLVSPKCDPKGFDAIKYSKHARELLLSAKICKSLSAATKGCRLAVGTTGILFRHFNSTIRSPITLQEFATKEKGSKEGKIALVFGSEGIGLTEKQVSACDFLITIPTSEEYPILNLSHAVAIVLYELAKVSRPKAYTPTSAQSLDALNHSFSLLVDQFASEMRNPRKAKIAFRRMLGKSMLTDKECAAILGVIRRTEKEIKKK